MKRGILDFPIFQMKRFYMGKVDNTVFVKKSSFMCDLKITAMQFK